MVKKIFSLFVVIILATVLVACSNEQEFDFDKGYITIGLEADYEPFNWLEQSPNDNNMPLEGEEGLYVSGYDVLIGNIIADELNLEVKYKRVEWSSLIPALRSGDIDLIIAGMSPTEQRKRTIAFTNNYYISNHVLLVNKDSDLASATSLNDLKDFNGVGQAGTVYSDIVNYLNSNYKSKVIPARDDMPSIIQALKGGVADFTAVEEVVAHSILNEHDEFVSILKSSPNNNIYELNDEDRDLSIGLRKKDVKLLNLINDILKNITQTKRDSLMNDALNKFN